VLCRREDGIFQQSWPGGEVGGKEAARLFSGYLSTLWKSQVSSYSTVSDLPSLQSLHSVHRGKVLSRGHAVWSHCLLLCCFLPPVWDCPGHSAASLSGVESFPYCVAEPWDPRLLATLRKTSKKFVNCLFVWELLPQEHSQHALETGF